MKLRRGLTLSLPAVLAVGCLLPSFETDQSLDPSGAAGGKGGSSGSSSTVGGEAGTPSSVGGAANAGEGGGGGAAPSDVMTADDEFVVVQETDLGNENVLDNDENGLIVTGFEDLETDIPDAYAATIDIAADGSLSFEPATGFFGAYRLRYDVENADGAVGSANVTIHVQPIEVELAAVADNVGGFCLGGEAGDGVGSAVSAAGDINGDGFGDLLIGAPGTDSSAGALYVLFGSAAPRSLELVPIADGEQEDRYFVLTGDAGSELGAATAPLGDVIGAAGDDFMVSAPAGDGTVYLVAGADTFSGALLIGDAEPITLAGGASDNAGRLLATGFDLTDDMVADPVVVVTQAASSNVGRYYVLDGAALASGSLSSEAVDAIDGSTANDNLTRAAAHVGDVDDDMQADLLLASARVIALVRGPTSNFPSDLANTSFTGTEGVWFDRLSGANDPVSLTGAGDFDGDGDRDLAYCEGTTDCVVAFGPVTDLTSGLTVTDLAGPAWISGDADLVSEFGADSDGSSELIVAQRDATADPDADQVFVLFGGSGQQAGSISVSGLGDQGFTLTAPSGSDIRALSPVGDVNGDGWQDFGVGDLGNDQVCVVLGGPFIR